MLRLVHVLTWSLVALALFQSFRGQGQHYCWVLLALLVPLVRCLLSSDFRQAVRTGLNDAWASLEAFHAERNVIPWRAVLIWGVLPFAFVFLTHTKTQVGDNAPVFLVAGSLVRQGNLEVSEYLALPEWQTLGKEGDLNACLVQTRHGIYSNYPAGPLQAAVPVAVVSRLLGGDFDSIKVQERLQKLTAAWLSAVCVGLFFLVALHWVPPTPAWMATLLFGFASAMFTTIGMGIWQHGGIIFWSLVFLVVELRQARQTSWKWTLLQGFALGWMLPWRPSALLVAGALGLWLLCRSPGRAIIVGVVAGLAFLPWGAFYWSCYGHLLGPTYFQANVGNWNWTSPDGFLGVLVSPGRGLFVYQTWLLLAGLWLWPAVRASQKNDLPGVSWWGLMATCGLAVTLNLILIGAWRCWWGGWCYGSRLNADVLPLAALLCLRPIAYLWQFAPGRGLVGGLLLLGFLIHGSCAYLSAEDWNGFPHDIDFHFDRLWHWDNSPFLYPLLRHFGGGSASM